MQKDLSDAELHEAVLATHRQIDLLNARLAHLTAEWEARDIWRGDGSRAAHCRLARDTGVSNEEAKHLLRRAQRLQSMPLTRAAFEAGELPTARVDLLCRANTKDLHQDFIRDESLLLEQVGQLRFADACRVINYWMQCADPLGTKDKADKQLRQRSCSISKTFQGSVDLRALFDPISGETFFNELKKIEDEFFKADWAAAKAIHGDSITIHDLERTPTQRRCDALVEMALRSAAMPAGARKPRPSISVIVDYESFKQLLQTANGTVLNPNLVIPHLTEADIETIIFGGPTRAFGNGWQLKNPRLFTGALRRAIELRDLHCQDPSGCDIAHPQCQVDHHQPYTSGGPTTFDNGKLLCDVHNRAKGADPP